MAELTKNRIAALVLIPYLAYIEALVTSTFGIILAPLIIFFIWVLGKMVPFLRSENTYKQARIVVYILTAWNLLQNENVYGSVVACIVLIAGIYACEATKKLWTFPVRESGVT